MKNKLIVFTTAMLPVFILSCSSKDSKNEKGKSPDAKYDMVTVAEHSLSNEVQLPGVLEPYEFVQVFPKVNGFVKNVYVDRGSHVKKGQLLLELEAPEIQQNMAASGLRFTQAQAMYQASKEKYDRMLETSKTAGTISAYDLSAAKAKMDAEYATMQAEDANYKAQKAVYAYLRVTAPFDGIVTERNIHPGALVGSSANSKAMLVIQQQDKLRLVVNIPEEYSSQFGNSDVKYTVNSLPGESFNGKISRASGCLSDKYRSETIEIDVPNHEHHFKAGMYAEVVIPEGGNKTAFTVPKAAVVTTTERKYVIAVRNGAACYVDVTQGNETADSTEVFGALVPGERVIASASYQVKNGQQVAPRGVAMK